MYAGELTYNEKLYRFIVKDQQLKLIPLFGDESFLSFMERDEATGAYTAPPKGSRCHAKYFIGRCYDSGKALAIIPANNIFGYTIDIFSEVSALTLPILHIAEFTGQARSITGISLMGLELDCIYPAYQFFGHKGKPFTDEEDERFSVIVSGFDETVTELGSVTIAGVEVACKFKMALSRNIYGKTPISMDSVLSLNFDETDDFEFIFNSINSVKRLLAYLCNRNSISFTKIKLMSSDDDGRQYESANISESPLLNQQEDDARAKKQFIPYVAVEGKLKDIFQDVIDGKMYMRHIPNTIAGGGLNVPNFIMIMTAFEGEHDRLNPNCPAPEQKKIDAQVAIKNELESLKKASTGKDRKEIYRRLISQIDHRPLNAEVAFSLKKHWDVLEPFIKHMYRINGIDDKISKIANRVCGQRNDFAHGNLTKPFDTDTISDILIIKYLVYVMQLSKHGIPKENIQGILKKLFDAKVSTRVTYV